MQLPSKWSFLIFLIFLIFPVNKKLNKLIYFKQLNWITLLISSTLTTRMQTMSIELFVYNYLQIVRTMDRFDHCNLQIVR